ncbi:MAG: hypothetical protein ACYTFY_17630 [Planctomycetota bacterium]|jgi:hypothetical protein
MLRYFLTAITFIFFAGNAGAVDLVKNNAPAAEIIIAEDATPSVKTAATELQRHLEKISGAKLSIVNSISPDVKNQVYIGKSKFTEKLGLTLTDVKDDGFKIIAKDNYLILAGKELYVTKTFDSFKKIHRRQRQAEWEKFTGQNWRFPPMHAYRDFSEERGFHTQDGTGSLYAVYEFLEQLGMRWYMPVKEIGIVYPKLADIVVKDQSLKKEPEFSQRILADPSVGKYTNEFLWHKSMKVGTSFVLPIYHSLSGIMLHRRKIAKRKQKKNAAGRILRLYQWKD